MSTALADGMWEQGTRMAATSFARPEQLANFFTEVAPCTNNAVFLGSFKRGVAAGAFSLAFVYTFSYRMTPTPVRIHLHRTARGTNWILVEKK